jgi:hypothetical protein
MRTRGKEETRSAVEYIGRELQSEWHLAKEHIRRELRKLYPPAGTPAGLHAVFRGERRRNLFRVERHRNVEALRFLLRRR